MLFGNGTGGVDWVLVCLGNPGEKYENTRHNVGFMVADELGERQHAPIQRLKYKALTNVFTISGQKVLVMKPVTFMNLSGEAVRQAVDFYKVAPDHVLVVSDDTALAVGRLRIRRGGSAGGHNGLKNIILHLGTDQFPRLRVGVGEKPHPDYDMADWVLGKFQGEDKKAIDRRGGVHPGRGYRPGDEPVQRLRESWSSSCPSSRPRASPVRSICRPSEAPTSMAAPQMRSASSSPVS